MVGWMGGGVGGGDTQGNGRLRGGWGGGGGVLGGDVELLLLFLCFLCGGRLDGFCRR